jgi:alcohol dehydrogenase (cytochrome c)
MHTFTKAGAIVGGAIAAVAMALPANAAEMTMQRMLNTDSEPHNWLMHHKNYFGHRFMSETQINTGNIANLRLVYTIGVGGIEAAGARRTGRLEGTPIVEDGFMYYPNGWGVVYKVDVRSGDAAEIVWQMDPATDRVWAAEVACCGNNNRGVVFWGNEVISITLDGRMISTNKESGEVTWERTVADPSIAETITLAPLIIRDISITGTAGAEYGVRGWLDATNLNDGTAMWRTHTAGGNDNDPNEIAKSTWLDDYNAWETGGGSIWQTGTYDDALNLMYWGTGNPGPDWDPEYRPGDNLYTDSLLAMDPDTGDIKWYFQYTPNDPYDYDEIAEHPLIDIEVNGTMRNLVYHPARNGFSYGFDRATGEFLYAVQYVNDVIWTEGIDPKTGLPTSYNPNTALQDYRGTAGRRDGRIGIHCPRISCGKNWPPSASDPIKGIMYVPGIEGCQLVATAQSDHPIGKGGAVKPRDSWTGGRFGITMDDMVGMNALTGREFDADEMGSLTESGSVVAIDVRTGETVNKIQVRYANRAGMLAAAGGWIMTGYLNGDIVAYDSDSLEEVWKFSTGAPIKATPMSYSVDGKQYVAIMVGGDVSGGNRTNYPELANIQFMHAVFVFTL